MRLCRFVPFLLAISILLVPILSAESSQETPTLDTTPPQPVPKLPGIVVLFDGNKESLQKNWTQNGKPAEWVIENGAMVTTRNDIFSVQKFTDFQLHLEFRLPYMPDKKGQGRANSGVFLQRYYEIQILDSYGLREPGSGGCGAVYRQAAPMVNACKQPLQWQTFDISFRAPRFDSNHKLLEQAKVSVWLNGILVQNNQVILEPTNRGTAQRTKPEELNQSLPLRLQFHGNSVAFRNIWVLPLPSEPSKQYDPK